MTTIAPSPKLPFQRVLITGGAGFIGSHLAERLLAAGCAVEVLDDLSTGSVHNIEGFRRHPQFELTVASVTDRSAVAVAVDRADVVYHLAAAVGVRLIVENPVRTIETNVSGTEVVLSQANKKGKRILLASTSEVYGKRTEVPFREDDDLILGASRRPRWAYACSKLLDEFLALAHHREHGLPVTVARLFNTVGPRQTGRYGMVIPRFVSQALRDEAITVYGDGSQTRTFCHVYDCVDALVGLLSTDATAGQVYNLGGQGEVSIRALAELIIARAGSASKIATIPFEQAYDEDFEDMQRRVPDLSKIQSAVGYAPRRPLETIVDDVLASTRAES
jgi:UDP-glucose 4-epimerase